MMLGTLLTKHDATVPHHKAGEESEQYEIRKCNSQDQQRLVQGGNNDR
jgi:hypothetical protein